jgi:catalase
MSSTKTLDNQTVADEVLQAFHGIDGSHPTFRPVHAKGILLAGRFTPSADAAALTRAPHAQHSSTPVTVRFSDTTGIPTIPDADANASPRGMAVRFHLAEHVHTDIIGHSVDGFPVRTVEEFLELLKAIGASGLGVPHPTPVEAFLGTHPAALRFVQASKPVPVSFFQESFFAVNALRFVNTGGAIRHGRFRVHPTGPNRYLDAVAASKQSANFLFDEAADRLQHGAVTMRIVVQMAADGDPLDDATAHWPDDHQELEFGTLELRSVLPNQAGEQQKIIFDPIPRVDGIESAGDPLLEPRATIYLASGRRRRAEHGE